MGEMSSLWESSIHGNPVPAIARIACDPVSHYGGFAHAWFLSPKNKKPTAPSGFGGF